MEQKRTLWIVSAVGVFLLVVVGAALIMYSPAMNSGNGQKTPSVAKAPGPKFNQAGNQFDKGENRLPPPSTDFVTPYVATSDVNAMPTSSNNVVSTEKTITSDNVTVYATTATVYGKDGKPMDLNDLKNGLASAQAADQKLNDNRAVGSIVQETTINVLPQPAVEKSAPNVIYVQPPAPSPQAVAKAESKPAAPAQKVEKKVEVAKAEVKPAAKPATAAKTESKPVAVAKATPKAEPKPAPAKTAAKPAAKPAPKEPDTFWIQVASYEMKKNADEARSALEDKKIKTEVFTFEKSGKLYYRVRVGPYTTKAEAQYWQNLIASTSGLDTKNSIVVTGTN